jgi:hypothetical protein
MRSSIRGRLPGIYIVGAQKCGTTSLFDWIAQHPGVYGNPVAKDIPFFALDDVYSCGAQHLANFSRKAPANSLILGGEVSAMFYPKAIARMHGLIPEAKLIAMLRNPVDRAFSAWRFAVERGLEARTFNQVVHEEMNGRVYEENAVDLAYKHYLARGKYAEQLENLYQYYPKEQVHIVLFEDMRDDPNGVVRGVFDFLQLADFLPDFSVKNVTEGGARFRLIQKLLYYPRARNDAFAFLVRELLSTRVRFLLRRYLEHLNRVQDGGKHEISPPARRQLNDYFKDDLVKLHSMLGMDLDGDSVLVKHGWGE